MLTKNSINFNQTEKYVKRRYSQALESDNQNEPSTKKTRKHKICKNENESDTLSFTDDVAKSHNVEFQDFLKYFMIPCNIYKSLAIRHKTNPIILKRNLSYLTQSKSVECQKISLQTIVDHLSTVRFHDENLALMKGKLRSKVVYPNYSKRIAFKFEHFMDSKSEKDWKTIEAVIYLDIVHFYLDKRKNKNGFFVKRVLSDQRIKCSDFTKDNIISHVVDITEIMKSASSYRVYKSMFHFKVLAKEKKTHLKQNSFGEKKIDDKLNEVFPVTYEAMMPLFSSTYSDSMRSSNYFVQPGKYQIFMEVTNMEKCDDSIYSGETISVYNADSQESGGLQLDSQWYKVDDPQHKVVQKNKAKITFQIDNDEPLKEKQKPMKTRNKSLTPVVEFIPYKAGTDSASINHSPELRLESIQLQSKPLENINIAYKFVVKDRIVQWTQTKYLTCPWCRLNFHFACDLFQSFTQLLAHLNNWHSKLTFSCKKLKSRGSLFQGLTNNFVTIEVRLTNVNPRDWDFGHVFLDKLPARRMPLTELIHTKHKKVVVKKRPKNHNRNYSHTWSAAELKEAEFEIDSEAEENRQWLFDQYYRKVEEFSDLNHIEKRVIQMWNRDLLKYGVYVGDTQLKNFVENFVQGIINDEQQLREVKSMRNTFMLHLVNLIDYGVLSSTVMLDCMKKLDEAMDKI